MHSFLLTTLADYDIKFQILDDVLLTYMFSNVILALAVV